MLGLPGSGLACTHRSKAGPPLIIATAGLPELRPNFLAKDVRQGAAGCMLQRPPVCQTRIHHNPALTGVQDELL